MKAGSGPIAVVRGPGEAVQKLFASVTKRWSSAGLKVAGVVAEPHDLPDRTCAAGIMRNIASGKPYPIYFDQAPVGTSCHLDAHGVDAACASVLDDVLGADIVVLSKFGKLEADGKGLLPVFRAAIDAGKPVVTTVSSKHREAWKAFAPDASAIEADEAALVAWGRHPE